MAYALREQAEQADPALSALVLTVFILKLPVRLISLRF